VSARAYIDRRAVVDSKVVGTGTRVWEFTHVLRGARIGRDCNLNSHVFVENDVVVGDRVTIKCGVYLWDGIRLESDVFVGPNVTFTNDRCPEPRASHASRRGSARGLDGAAASSGPASPSVATR
jgi:NDP-sugar pyrophosphorylase family protein